MTGVDWEQVRDRVLALRLKPRSDPILLPEATGWTWRPTTRSAQPLELPRALSEAEIQDAEAFLGVRLPADYRDFLRYVAAGGVPTGIFPLLRHGDGWRWDAPPSHPTDIDRLREPFVPSHIEGVEIDPRLLRATHPWTFEYREQAEENRREWERIIWHPDRTAGAICLCDGGCFYKYWLVVTGEERGTIWRDHRIDSLDLAPLFDAQGNRMTFGRWLLAWLDQAEQAQSS